MRALLGARLGFISKRKLAAVESCIHDKRYGINIRRRALLAVPEHLGSHIFKLKLRPAVLTGLTGFADLDSPILGDIYIPRANTALEAVFAAFLRGNTAQLFCKLQKLLLLAVNKAAALQLLRVKHDFICHAAPPIKYLLIYIISRLQMQVKPFCP